jgi:predicted enzyme related to lactoylglutathione lyase
MQVVINWFEIPVKDVQRAKAFYEKVFDTTLTLSEDSKEFQMCEFPDDSPNPGALVKHSGARPSNEGVILYFGVASEQELDAAVKRVEEAGGTIIEPKFMPSEDAGFICIRKDSEGNRIAFHCGMH